MFWDDLDFVIVSVFLDRTSLITELNIFVLTYVAEYLYMSKLCSWATKCWLHCSVKFIILAVLIL